MSWKDKLRALFGSKPEPEKKEPPPKIVIPEVKISRQAGQPLDFSMSVSGVDTVFLRQQMMNHLSLEELAEACDALALTPLDQLEGGKGRKVLQVVQGAEQARKAKALVAWCEERKTAVSWQPT